MDSTGRVRSVHVLKVRGHRLARSASASLEVLIGQLALLKAQLIEFFSETVHDHLRRDEALGALSPQNVTGVVLGGEEEQQGVAVVLDIISQLGGFDILFPLLVRAWLAATFPVPDRELHVRNRPLDLVVVAARVGAEGEGTEYNCPERLFGSTNSLPCVVVWRGPLL